jgi:hypothetical protein
MEFRSNKLRHLLVPGRKTSLPTDRLSDGRRSLLVAIHNDSGDMWESLGQIFNYFLFRFLVPSRRRSNESRNLVFEDKHAAGRTPRYNIATEWSGNRTTRLLVLFLRPARSILYSMACFVALRLLMALQNRHKHGSDELEHEA